MWINVFKLIFLSYNSVQMTQNKCNPLLDISFFAQIGKETYKRY